MIDFRITTFITLYETMNYHKTALLLNMTQPAVTQHIKYLENMYNTKLFIYENKKLTKTENAIKLHDYANQIIYISNCFLDEIKNPKIKFRLGASKSIGNYLITNQISKLITNPKIDFNLTVSNTKDLLYDLDNGRFDITLLEGYFDKSKYDSKLYKYENFVGICNTNHKFANKEVELNEIFNELLLCREDGSGSKEILSTILKENNLNINCFRNINYLSSIEVIKSLVQKNIGISFVYQTVVDDEENISIFKIKNIKMIRELNFVYLKNTNGNKFIELFK